jgi:transposase-like protein
MAKHRTHSIEFKRQVTQEFFTGETFHGLAKRHDISRNLHLLARSEACDCQSPLTAPSFA